MKLRLAMTMMMVTLGACDDPGSSSGTPTTTSATTSEPDATTTTEDTSAPVEDTTPLPVRGGLIGTGDGTPSSVAIVELYRPSKAIEATDLDFHPERDELWIVNRPFEKTGLCSENNLASARCRSLESTTTILFEPGTPNQRDETLMDDNAWHFMRRAPGIAMGALDTFATCGEAATGNFEDDPVTYIGPTLWSADLDIYTHTPPGGNGSHIDMLHETPFCMGIAHERDNVYWLFDGEFGSIDRIDFHDPHEVGGEDHSDGEVHRYIDDELLRLPGVPSGLEFRAEDHGLYIVDSGNDRVLMLDTTSGDPGGALQDQWEELADSGRVVNADVREIVLPGVMDQPSGLAIDDDVLYVSDHATSKLYAFDILTGATLRELDTGLPSGTLGGITIGPDKKVYFVDMLGGAVYRIDP